MRSVLNVLTGVALAAALPACVSTGKYETLQKAHDAKVVRVQELETALAAEKARVDALTAERNRLVAERDRLAAQLGEKQAALAGVLKDQAQLETSLKDMQQALAELEARKRAAEARVAEFRDLLARFKPLIDTGRLRVKISDGRMVVEMGTDILFASGSAELSDEGKQAIRQVAQVLASIEGKRFQVEGHTDNVPIKTARYPSNWELAAARALTVVKAMIEAGMAPERISGASFGEFKPTADNATDEGRAANRRIEIVVVPDLSTLPGFEELEALGSDRA